MAHQQLDLNPEIMLLRLQVQLDRLSRLVATALEHVDSVNAVPERMPGVFFQTMLAGTEPLPVSIEDWREEYRWFVLAAAFRDAVELVQLYLNEVRTYARFIEALAEQPVLPMEVGRRIVEDERVEFERLGLPQRIERLRRTFPFEWPLLNDSIFTLNHLRNEFVHGMGRVRPWRTREGMLEAWWEEPHIAVIRADGSEEIASAGPVLVSFPQDKMQFRYREVKKAFAAGAPVIISATEFGQIVWTIWRWAFLLKVEVARFGIAKGVYTEKPKADETPSTTP